MTIEIKRDTLIRLEQELRAAQDLGNIPRANELRRACKSAWEKLERSQGRIEIKRDRDSWVVTVDGKVHPQGVGFPTKRAAKKWIKQKTPARCSAQGFTMHDRLYHLDDNTGR